jgi:hypothetical protein
MFSVGVGDGNTDGGVALDRGKSPLFAVPRGKMRHREQVFQKLTVVGRSVKTHKLVVPTFFLCWKRVLFLGLCRVKVRAFCRVERDITVILGTGRANSSSHEITTHAGGSAGDW